MRLSAKSKERLISTTFRKAYYTTFNYIFSIDAELMQYPPYSQLSLFIYPGKEYKSAPTAITYSKLAETKHKQAILNYKDALTEPKQTIENC